MAKERLKITGEFNCKVFEHGKLIKEYTGKNLVVNNGLDALTQFLGTHTMLDIAKIGVGTNNTAPAASDMNLTATTFYKVLGSHTFPTHNSIRFNWTIDNSEANGIHIKEFGLLFSDDSLFARKTGLTVAKTSSISLTGYWIITIS